MNMKINRTTNHKAVNARQYGELTLRVLLLSLVLRYRQVVNGGALAMLPGKQLISILKQRDKVFGSLTMYFILRATGLVELPPDFLAIIYRVKS